jgi:hypothetical protein
MYELKKIVKLFKIKFDVTGHSSYEKRIYRAAVSKILEKHCIDPLSSPLHALSLNGGCNNRQL